MRIGVGLWAVFCVLGIASGAWGQLPSSNGQYPRAQQQPARPDQPVVPQDPTLQRRGPQAPLARRFNLTPAEQAQLDRVLQFWQNSSSKIKEFSCNFDRLEFRPAFGNAPQTDKGGEIRYAAPDKGSFRVDGARPERWICDGKAVYGYDFQTKQIFEKKLPPEMQGRAIAEGPLPFLFGANAASLKRRYDMWVSTPQDANKGEVWIEAYPLFAQDARNFSRAEIILSQNVPGCAGELLPKAIQIYQPNGTDRTVFVFSKIALNESGFWNRFRNDFAPTKPGMDWQFVADNVPAGNPPMAPPPQGNVSPSVGNRPISPR